MYRRIIFILFLVLAFSCQDEAPDDITTTGPKEKPIPESMQYLEGTVAKEFNMNGAKVYSLHDSAVVQDGSFRLLVKKDSEGQIFITDVTGEKVLALVNIKPQVLKLTVDAEKVSHGLLDLLPNYVMLDEEQQNNTLDVDIAKSEQFLTLIKAVTDVMAAGKDIYDMKHEDLLQAIVSLNSHIGKEYFPAIDEGGRLSDSEPNNIQSWLYRGGNAGKPYLYNPIWSHAEVNFKAISSLSSNELVTMPLDPREYYISDEFQEKVSLSSLTDDCFEVKVTQSSQAVKNKNIIRLTGGLISLTMGKIMGMMDGDAVGAACAYDMAENISSELHSQFFSQFEKDGDTGVSELVSLGVNVSLSAGFNFLNSDKCHKISGGVLLKRFLGRRIRAIIEVITKVNSLKDNVLTDYATFRHSIVALVEPVELTEKMQLHDSKLKEACVEVVKDGTLKVEYSAGEKIHPSIKLIPQSQYAEWEKAGFKVNWKVDAGNGSVSLAGIKVNETKTDPEGKAIVEWTLPEEKTEEAVLTAEVKDKEGDHIAGSPIKFKVKVEDHIKFYELEITNYRSDYSLLKPVFTLKPNDKIKLPNRLLEMVRLKYKGTYVKVGPYGLDATNHYLKLDKYPVDADDHYVGKYIISIKDVTNNREVRFPIDLTLNNEIYRGMVGKTITADIPRYGYKNAKITLNTDLTATLTTENGYVVKGSYVLNHGHTHSHIYADCPSLGPEFGPVVDKRIVGYVYFGEAFGGVFYSVDYVVLFEDGSLGGRPDLGVCSAPDDSYKGSITINEYRF
ncbi:hypothetical protein [Cesiribacter sp. SM1]|uniref:hypothetical protein n=1 Tax=Cesiribacter sp. SM1 TaxID=2861196 RepID=UPI001CD20549|nr:hypothetical protein [Cesiribacter sp. SM1]